MRKLLILCSALFVGVADAQEAVEEVTDLYARDTYRIDTLVCPFKEEIDYEPGEIECGLLQVPENRENPDSRFIELLFVKLASTWDDEESEDDEEDDAGLEPGRRDDPVIYLTGGPGVGANLYVERFVDHGIRKHRDLYILEQRGIKNSGDFCLTYAARNVGLKNVATLEEAAAAHRNESAACAQNAAAAGVDLSAYNTIENARDVKALRVALGFDDWNVWGISYGTLLGQAYLREDPDGIRAIILDAIVPLNAREVSTSWRVVSWYDRDLKKLDELCQADASCAKRYPDLGERVREGARAAMENPITVETKDTEFYPTGKAHILSDVAALLPFSLFYEQSNYPALPAVIHAWADAVEDQDEALFKMLAIGLSEGSHPGSHGMYDAVMCNDGYRDAMQVSSALDRVELPVLSSAVAPEGDDEAWTQLCRDHGMTPRPLEDFAAVQTDIPALLVEGDMDPITPPPLAHIIAPGFSNGTYVEFPYAGHGPSRSVECAGDMMNKFFDDPTAPPDLTCVDEMEPPEFVSLYHTSIVPRMAVLAMENKEDLPKVGAWAGVSVLGVLVGFIVLTFAPLVRRLENRKPAASNGARIASWGASFAAVASLAIFGAAAGVTYQISEVTLIFGLVGWAALGAWLGVLAGILGIVAVVMTVMARRNLALPIGSLLGFIITGVASVSLSLFLMVWGLRP